MSLYGNKSPKLSDIDECAEDTDGCTQACTNEIGGYSCSCGSGYRLASNGRECVDIDECTEGIDGCDHTCTNTIGSYTCSCDSGYILARDGQMCNGEFLIMSTSLGIGLFITFKARELMLRRLWEATAQWSKHGLQLKQEALDSILSDYPGFVWFFFFPFQLAY